MAKRRLIFKPRSCATCGREFTPVNGRQRVCSPACGLRTINGKRVPRTHRVTCAECGREFVSKNSRRIYCTAECKSVALRRMAGARPPRDPNAPRREKEAHKRVCPICGAEFDGFGKQIYCSVPCRKRGAYLRTRAKRPPKPKRSTAAVCPICGQTFEAIAPSGQRKKFCSPQCRNEANRQLAWERSVILRGGDPTENMKHACVVCGATFVSRRPHARFCSDACRAVAAAAYQRRHYRDLHTATPRHAVVTCPICGKEFERQAYNRRYCSERCRHAAYRKRKHLAPGDRNRACLSCGETFESIGGRVCCTPECSRWHGRHTGKPGPWPYTLRECALCGEEFRAFSDEETLCAYCSANGKTPRENGRMGEFVRRCHDCGRKTTQYRCPSCLARWRKKHGVTDYAVAEGEDYA